MIVTIHCLHLVVHRVRPMTLPQSTQTRLHLRMNCRHQLSELSSNIQLRFLLGPLLLICISAL
ncbi:Protein of unknown function [Pyronema omphalodes CBS 100304]|uniref:Uncharacterized protein n=1 Tax=Pyronema omphalodes (strain CBS 100304) TaxID=1076935 RepID=U4L905_PYROM|nr:Protein of unknown function [Pyronema omphalodes CBS 100304]